MFNLSGKDSQIMLKNHSDLGKIIIFADNIGLGSLFNFQTELSLMKNHLRFYLKIGIIALFITSLISGCVPLKRIEYLQQEVEENEKPQEKFTNKTLDVYRVRPGDNLYIKVNSALAGSGNLFAEEDLSRSSNYYNDAGIYLNSYLVSDSGFIDFPFVGKIFLKDLTLEQSKDLITSIVNDYIKESTVIVRLAMFKISALGEVNRPGSVNVYQNNLNVFEAISMAGDLTTFAKRDKVYVVRQTPDGSKVNIINLNDVNILSSEYYYIQPDDIIYVPPVKGKNFAFANFPYALIFTTITTTLLLIEYFK